MEERKKGFNFLDEVKNLTKKTSFVVFIVIILISVFVHIITKNFFTPYNLSTLSRSVSFTILVGFAQTLVLLTGGIDLSVASIGSVCSMISAQLLVHTGLDAYLVLFISASFGLVLGGINGLIISRLKITPFIVTLATAEIYKGIVYVITMGMPIIGLPDKASNLANGMIGGFFPNVLLIMLIICTLLVIMLKYTKFGRHIYAIGGNRHCAEILGIRSKNVELKVYALSGLLAATAGVLTTYRLSSFQASIGENWVMPSVTAAVLGGTSMLGGVGGVLGTIIGGLMSGVISVSITLLSVSSYWEKIVTGGIVLIAVIVFSLRSGQKRS